MPAALRSDDLCSSQSSLLGALEEGLRLQAALEESERLCQDAAAARDDLRCRLHTTELEGAALRDAAVPNRCCLRERAL